MSLGESCSMSVATLADEARSWSDRIPSVFLLEIASSVENLQEKMSQATMRHLDGVAFESVNAGHSLERIFKAATSPDIYRSMWIGPGLNKLMLDRQLEHIQSASSFTQASKVRSPLVSFIIMLIRIVCVYDAFFRQPVEYSARL